MKTMVANVAYFWDKTTQMWCKEGELTPRKSADIWIKRACSFDKLNDLYRVKKILDSYQIKHDMDEHLQDVYKDISRLTSELVECFEEESK